ncbi:MAG TPA: M28 family peptidase [Gemmatimonadales bacterium]|nr:M28 family peptidase [Gemmatimonadales bacterium]
MPSISFRLPARRAAAAAALAGALATAAASACAPARPPAPASPAPRLAALDELQTRLARDVSGDSAYRTVAFVEQFWRQPGSVGFDTTIADVAARLRRAGYVPEDAAPAGAPLVYRIERRPLDRPGWAPLDATLALEGGPTLLRFATNRNMLLIGSASTPDTGVVAEVVSLAGRTPQTLGDVAGKIVFADSAEARLLGPALQAGAAGVLVYRMPAYTQPATNRTAIQFGALPRGVPADSTGTQWAIALSFEAREGLKQALARGPVRARVATRVAWRAAPELTLVAEARGRTPQRFVFSAHVQEPGANDNASGVGTQAEMARVLASLVRTRAVALERTITFVWGDEIRAIARYLKEDSVRARDVRFGLSLDMVGENTAKTGGTFLIEKMPDPSAVWTRGDDHHTEWGGEPLTVQQLTPHWYNDFVLGRCRAVARATPGGWVVRANPYEGGSDHTPFLEAGKPGLLMWHFTDQFYHTDLDRLDKVSPEEMARVGRCALATAVPLATADAATARFVAAETRAAALDRLAREFALSRDAIAKGGDRAEQRRIVATWGEWYDGALRAVAEVPVDGPDAGVQAAIEAARADVRRAAEDFVGRLK